MVLDTAHPWAGPHWYAVHCVHFKERQVSHALASRYGLTVYLPELHTRQRLRPATTPFFPGYLFVHADLTETGTQVIDTAPGVIRLVRYGDEPQPIPGEAIQLIFEGVEHLNAHGGKPTHDFVPNEVVRVRSGAFQGLTAIFIGPSSPARRVEVLIELMGRLTRTELEVGMLERPAGEHRPHHRTTRGRGRRINYPE